MGPARSGVPLLHVLGWDPGQDTGWAYLRAPQNRLLREGFRGVVFDDDFWFRAGTIDCRMEGLGVTEMVDVMRKVWEEDVDEEAGDLFVVGIEDFILFRPEKDRSLLSPVRITARYQDRLREVVFPLFFVSPNDSKTTITDARLRSWNLYLPGPDHPRDAIRVCCMTARQWAGVPRFRDYVAARQIEVSARAAG